MILNEKPIFSKCLIQTNKLHINKIENILKFSDLLFEFDSLYKKCIAIVRSEKIKIS